MKFCILTLGCKVNKYESDSLMFELKQRGHVVTDKLESADIVIINTCAVTNEAEKKSRQMIERAKKLSPNAEIFIMGCASQNRPEQFEKDGVKLICGTAGKMKILDKLEESGIELKPLPIEFEEMSQSLQTKTRAYIKIQDGCDRFCTYCIIPYLRGRSRSRKLENIIREVEKLPEFVKEIVLVGIDVSDFRIDGEKALHILLEKLDVFGKRLRLSSMEDSTIDEEFLLALKKLKNFCPHFHLSLQSGSDNVLKKMNRHYTTEKFEESVKLIRKYFPLAGITTDLIVGFPTETEEDFLQSCEFARKVKFSQMHIFPYSKRNGTAAAKLYTDLRGDVKTLRLKKMEQIARQMQEEFILKNTFGKVLIEEKNDKFFEGYTENYIKCYFEGDFNVGDIVCVKNFRIFKDGALVDAFYE